MDEMAAINEAIRLRGLFVHRYSGVEYTVSALILHAQQHDAYSDFTRLPWSWSSKKGGKVERLRDLVNHGGPLDAYRQDIKTYLDMFADLEGRRHFMVHAIMAEEKHSGGEPRFRFVMHRPATDGTEYGLMSATMTEMEALAEAVQPISTGLSSLAAKILRTIDVPPIVAMFDPDAPPPFNVTLGPRI